MKKIKTRGQSDRRAFTIIEVVLVLAVAGLIFLVVFAAIPRLQASRRDNQRKRDLETIAGIIIEYQSNTGDFPVATIVQSAFQGDTTAPTGTFVDYIDEADLQDPHRRLL